MYSKITTIFGFSVFMLGLLCVNSQQALAEAKTIKTDDSADEIELSIEKGEPDKVTFCLKTVASITWWKGIHIFAPNNKDVIGLLATSDQDHGPSCRSIETAELGTRLEFLKAKAFGVHTGVGNYSYSPKVHAGNKLTFTWRID